MGLLYKVPLERVEDSALAWSFREKQEELDRQITMLSSRHYQSFLYESLQLYGGVDETSLQQAQAILYRAPSRHPDKSAGGTVSAREYAERGRAEIAYYRSELPEVAAEVRIRGEVIGLMVSSGPPCGPGTWSCRTPPSAWNVCAWASRSWIS